jgi:hypothetical protein
MATIDINQLIQESLSDYSSKVGETEIVESEDLQNKLKEVVLNEDLQDKLKTTILNENEEKEIIKKEQLEESEDFNSISIGTGLLGAALAARKIIKK